MLREITQLLGAGGIEDPATDAQLILGHVLGESRGRVQALAFQGSALEAELAHRALAMAEERAQRIPLQHLTGRAPFRAIELSVGPGVFIPRPETESVAQFAIDALQQIPVAEPLAVDLCTGSGAIALSIAHEVPTARVWAVEKSVEAHAWASRNVAEWGDKRVELLLGDLSALDPRGQATTHAELDSYDEAYDSEHEGGEGELAASAQDDERLKREFAPLAGRVHVLISNPPYVPASMVPKDPEVRDHDPELALYGGADGLDIIRVISRIGRELVVPGGLLVLEHAELQGQQIRDLLTLDGWNAAATHHDLTGRDRTTTALR